MSEISLKKKYELEREDFNLYLSKSKNLRLIIKIFSILTGSSIALMILSGIFNMDIPLIFKPEFTFTYIYTSISFFGFIFGVPVLLVFWAYLNRIKTLCGYEFINIPFIHIFESHSSLHNYLEISKDVYKYDFIKSLKKGLNTINDWNYGNIPFIVKDVENQIDFLKNDFKYVAKRLINSREINDRFALAEILYCLCDFLYNPSLDYLNQFYSKAIKYKIEKPIIKKETRNKLKLFIENHPAISQTFFTIFLDIITYLLGKKVNAEIITIISWIFVVSIGSFTIFDKIKNWIS